MRHGDDCRQHDAVFSGIWNCLDCTAGSVHDLQPATGTGRWDFLSNEVAVEKKEL